MRTLTIGILATLAIIGGASNANAYPVQITGPETLAEINKCNDGLPVYWDTVTHEIYGDQDNNGVLAGTDCDWK